MAPCFQFAREQDDKIMWILFGVKTKWCKKGEVSTPTCTADTAIHPRDQCKLPKNTQHKAEDWEHGTCDGNVIHKAIIWAESWPAKQHDQKGAMAHWTRRCLFWQWNTWRDERSRSAPSWVLLEQKSWHASWACSLSPAEVQTLWRWWEPAAGEELGWIIWGFSGICARWLRGVYSAGAERNPRHL